MSLIRKSLGKVLLLVAAVGAAFLLAETYQGADAIRVSDNEGVEHRLTPHLLEVKEGARMRHGAWDCEYFAVNHSIPDALSVAIRSGAGVVLHTGDFKMDQLPLDGRITDLAGFARLGAQGVDLLLSDSTNAEIPGFVTPEREIGPVLDAIFARARGRIIVASFEIGRAHV